MRGLQASSVLPLLSYTTSKSPWGIAELSAGSPHCTATPWDSKLPYWLNGAFLDTFACSQTRGVSKRLEQLLTGECWKLVQCRSSALSHLVHLIAIVQDGDLVVFLEQCMGQVQANEGMGTRVCIYNQAVLTNHPEACDPAMSSGHSPWGGSEPAPAAAVQMLRLHGDYRV